jgi:predicted DCC family thiol-disulfide oxidoreductase YuxK
MTARAVGQSDPAAPESAATSRDEPILFFDASCGLCRRSVRLLLRIDRQRRLLFAAIGGRTWDALVAPEARETLPDSAVLRRPDGRLFARSAAILEALHTAGGPWTVLACLGRLVPSALADRLYDAVARRRREAAACPFPQAPAPRFLP